MKNTKKPAMPIPRNFLHKVMKAIAQGSAAGKHKARPVRNKRIRDEDFSSSFF